MTSTGRRIVSALSKGFVAVPFVAAALMVTVAAFATRATAAPYSTQATLSANTQNPAVDGSLILSGQGFGANEAIGNTLHTTTFALNAGHTDASGSFTVTVTLPAGVSGAHTITSIGAASGRTASLSIFIGPLSQVTGGSRGGGGGGGGGLSNTGVAVIGIAGLGVVLLIGGGIMLLSGKRRRVRA